MNTVTFLVHDKEVRLTGRWAIETYNMPYDYIIKVEVYEKLLFGIKRTWWIHSDFLREINTCGE